MEIGNLTGAGYGEKSPARLVQRNGHRGRDWQTRVGTVELCIQGSGRAATSPAPRSYAGWRNGRSVSVAVIVAVSVNSDGRREVLGMEVGPSEAEPFWTAFLRKLMRRGLRGVKLVISDVHEGIKAAVAKLLCASWQATASTSCAMH